MKVRASHGRVRKPWISRIRRYFTSEPESVNMDEINPQAKKLILRMLANGELIEEKDNE